MRGWRSWRYAMPRGIAPPPSTILRTHACADLTASLPPYYLMTSVLAPLATFRSPTCSFPAIQPARPSDPTNRNTHADEPVLGLKLLLALLVVVDEAKALGRAATELGLEAKDDDLLGLGLVERGELLRELLARHVGARGVEDGQDELLAVEQAVRDELGRAEGDGAGGVLF